MSGFHHNTIYTARLQVQLNTQTQSVEKLAVLSIEIIISHAMRYSCEKKNSEEKRHRWSLLL